MNLGRPCSKSYNWHRMSSLSSIVLITKTAMAQKRAIDALIIDYAEKDPSEN